MLSPYELSYNPFSESQTLEFAKFFKFKMPILDNVIHEQFAQHYALNGHSWLAGQAAGLATRQGAYAVLHRTDVEARVQEILHQRFSKAGITAERTMKELARIAYGSVADLYDEEGRLLPPHLLPDDVAANVSRIKVELVGEGHGENRVLTVVKDIKLGDKMAALTILSRHFKIVGDESDGVNALANALADRLKQARQRDYANTSDARIVDPQALPQPDPEAPDDPTRRRGMRLEYAVPGDPSNAEDVSTPRMVVPVRNPEALHSRLPEAEQVERVPRAPRKLVAGVHPTTHPTSAQPTTRPQGAPHEDELW